MFPTYSRPLPYQKVKRSPHPPMKRKKGWSKTITTAVLKKSGKETTSKENLRVECNIVMQVSVYSLMCLPPLCAR